MTRYEHHDENLIRMNNLNANNNEEEPIYLSSSEDDMETAGVMLSSNNRRQQHDDDVEFVSESDDEEVAGDENDNSRYNSSLMNEENEFQTYSRHTNVNDEDDEELDDEEDDDEEDDDEHFGRHSNEFNTTYEDDESVDRKNGKSRRPIKVYDEYDPENMDNDFDDDELSSPNKVRSIFKRNNIFSSSKNTSPIEKVTGLITAGPRLAGVKPSQSSQIERDDDETSLVSNDDELSISSSSSSDVLLKDLVNKKQPSSLEVVKKPRANKKLDEEKKNTSKLKNNSEQTAVKSRKVGRPPKKLATSESDTAKKLKTSSPLISISSNSSTSSSRSSLSSSSSSSPPPATTTVPQYQPTSTSISKFKKTVPFKDPARTAAAVAATAAAVAVKPIKSIETKEILPTSTATKPGKKLSSTTKPDVTPPVSVTKPVKVAKDTAVKAKDTTSASINKQQQNVESKTSQAVLPGRVIQLGSGFKIPKRANAEAAVGDESSPTAKIEPPGKKPKMTVSSDTVTDTVAPLVKKPSSTLPANNSESKQAKPVVAAKQPSLIKKDTPPTVATPSPLAAPKTNSAVASLNNNNSKTANKTTPTTTKYQESDEFLEALSKQSTRYTKALSNNSNKSNNTSSIKNSLTSATNHTTGLLVNSEAQKLPSNQNDQTSITTNLPTVSSSNDATSSKAPLTTVNPTPNSLLTNTNTSNLNALTHFPAATTSTANNSNTFKDEIYDNLYPNRANSPDDLELSEMRINVIQTVEYIMVKSNLVHPGAKKSISRKKVNWSEQIESTHTFYLDESEKVIKKNAFNTVDMAKIEKLNEKELRFKMISSPSLSNEVEESNVWPELIPIDLPDTIVTPEVRSLEKEIQALREQTTLAVLMFKRYLPDSPSEPDVEPNTQANLAEFKTKLIPLEDTNDSFSSNGDINEDVNAPSSSSSSTPRSRPNNTRQVVENTSESASIRQPAPRVNERRDFYNPSMNLGKTDDIRMVPPPPSLLRHPPKVAKTPLLSTPPLTVTPKVSADNTDNFLSILNLSNAIIPNNQEVEKLKKILNQINQTNPKLSTSESSKPVSVSSATREESGMNGKKTFNNSNIPVDSSNQNTSNSSYSKPFTSRFSSAEPSSVESRRPSKWNSTTNSNNNTNISNDSQNAWSKNVNNSAESSNDKEGSSFKRRSGSPTSIRGRNIFVNSFSRGIGQRPIPSSLSSMQRPHNKYNNNSSGNFRNSNNDNEQANDRRGYNNNNNSRGGGSIGYKSNNSYNNQFNNRHNHHQQQPHHSRNQNDHHHNRGHFNPNRNYSDKASNSEGDSGESKYDDLSAKSDQSTKEKDVVVEKALTAAGIESSTTGKWI